MKVEEFDDIPDQDDLAIQIEQFKMGVISRATGGEFENDDYKRIRKIILGNSETEKLAPRFLKICRTADDFWGWIKGEAQTYAERREIINQAINPILDYVEYEASEGALEFKKNFSEKGVIGNGGFGQVYLYEHKLLKLPFAVKIFAPAFYEGGDGELERFFQEAKMLFKLNHPSIIRIHDAGLLGKRPFIRMEYFEGRNLNQILSEFGVINPGKALVFMKSIVSGMLHAHENSGIIHRDLKPSNIMAAVPGQFRIVDFGMGIFVENELHSRLTKTGEITVSGYYTAPELLRDPKLIDKRSDIYSLGALWYTMISGDPPAGSSVLSRLNTIEGISDDYKKCIINCLQDLDSRYPSCVELMDDMNKL